MFLHYYVTVIDLCIENMRLWRFSNEDYTHAITLT